MAFVEKQLIPINFSQGLDTKSDPLQIQAGKLLELENGEFTKNGRINKRAGFDQLNKTVENGSNLSNAEAISTFNNELCLFDGNHIYSYIDATGNWLNRGTAVSVIAQEKQILRTSDAQQLNPDVAYSNGIEVYAWEDSSGGVRYSVLDNVTKAFCVSDVLLYAFGARPKCIAFDDHIYVMYTDDVNNLFYRKINPKNPTVVGSQITLLTDGYTADFTYDATVIGSRLFVALLSSATATGAIDLLYYDTNMSPSAITSVALHDQAFSGAGEVCLNVVGDALQNVWISWANGSEVRSACYSYNMVPVLTNTVVDGYATGIETITAIESDSGIVTIAYEVGAIQTYNELIKIASLTQSGVVTSLGTIRSVGLASKCFSYNDNQYVNIAHESTLQATYFTVLLDGTDFPIVSKIAAQNGGGLRTNNMLAEVVEIDSGQLLWANSKKGKLISEANTLFQLLGVNSTLLDFVHSNRFLPVTQSNNLLFVGGFLQSYDGVSVVEHGFHLYPENITAVPAGSDGSLSSGSYQYCATFEWSDNLGQVHRSAPSIPVTVNASATNHVTLTVPTLRLSAKQNPRSNPIIVIYRTEVDGSNFYRVTSAIAPLVNDMTVDSVQFVDVLSDSSLIANELIYTSGNVLANIAPPACSLITLYQNRVIVGGLEDGNLLWFSKNKFDNSNFNTIPAEFAAENTIGCDPRGGNITALGTLDDKLVIFKRSFIFILAGDGPNDTGGGNLFPDPQALTSDVGCNNPNSIVTTPIGLMFKSDKGIYLLDRSEQVSYIGAPVEVYNSLTITSATLNQKANQVLFGTSDGVSLVYDYFAQQWSTWTNLESKDSDIFQGELVLVKNNGRVLRRNESSFKDAGKPIKLSWTTPNLSFAGLNGYQSVFKCFILGSYKGAHSLEISVAYDNNSAYTQFATIDASQDVTVWGSDDLWGDSSPWGGDYNIYQFRLDFARHKCTSIRLKVSDSQTSNYNEGYSISAVTFEAGILGGGNRLRGQQVKGTR